MAFFDQAQEMLSAGIDTARGAVSGVAMEQLGFVRGFVRLCNDGWEQGWHEPQRRQPQLPPASRGCGYRPQVLRQGAAPLDAPRR